MSIKNADMPAMPNDLHPADAGMLAQFQGGVNAKDLTRWHCGLTKREHFAGMAMQAILSNEQMTEVGDHPEWVASSAVQYADALLAELEKQS